MMNPPSTLEVLCAFNLRRRSPKARVKHHLDRLLQEIRCVHREAVCLLDDMGKIRPDLTEPFRMILDDLTAARGRCGKAMEGMKRKK